MERRTKARAQTSAYLFIVALILVAANVISFGVYKRVDMTKAERFTLSKGSARLVSEGLKQDLQIDVYVTRGLPKTEAFIQDLIDLMNEYERASNGRLKYAIIEAKTEEQKAAAKEAGLQEAAFGEGSETGADQATISRGFMGMAFKYGSEKEAIPILSPDSSQGLEFWITNKIREIRDRADNVYQKFGVISGKDEIKISDANLVAAQGGRGGPSMKSILDQALPFYKIEEVDLQGGDAEINKELAGILITQPGKDFTEKELRRIDQFLMEGNKSIVIYAGAVNIKASDASMKAELNTHGLEKLLDGYGIEMKKEAILDWGGTMRIPVQSQNGGMAWLRANGVVQLQHIEGAEDNEQTLDNAFAGFFRIDELSFPFPSTLVMHPDKQPAAQMKAVARSTPNSTVSTAESIDMKFTNDLKPKGELGQRVMAVVLEGKIKSAFGGGEQDGINLPAESKDKSRLLVVSASQFLANPFARAGSPPPMPPQMAMMGAMGGDEDLLMLSMPYAQKYLTATILAFKNTLDWMGGDSDLIATSAKLLQEPNLKYADIAKPKQEITDDEASLNKKVEEYKLERERLQQKIKWTLTFLGPAFFAAFGLFRWRRREAARESTGLE